MMDVTQHGVRPDGATLNTAALQKLIDRCGESGGGTLVFPPGRYVTGGLRLRDHVHLVIESGATLLGSVDLADYFFLEVPPVRFSEDQEGLRALLYAHGCRGIRLSGEGTIDGRGPLIENRPGLRAGRPRLIWFAECDDVKVAGLRLRNSAFWMQHYLKCTRLRLHGLDVFNHGSCNNDGCDIDCCRDVIVSDCSIDSHDDALCLKSGNDRPTENVVITNCITRTHCNHFKTGTDSNGGFRNITASNWQMVPSTVTESGSGTEGADWRGACGIALGCVDGGMLDNISVSHVQMDQVRVPFFIRLGDRGTPVHGSGVRQPVAYARDIRLSHISARRASPTGCYIMGLPDAPVRRVSIEGCRFEFEGGGNDAQAEAPVPLRRDAYPSCDAFGTLPSFGIFLRDVDEVEINGLSLAVLAADARPALRWQRGRDIRLNNVRETSP